jgi:hypothetical protein
MTSSQRHLTAPQIRCHLSVQQTRLTLTPLSVTTTKPETDKAARRLKGAHDSVQGLFDALYATRAAKAKAGGSLRVSTYPG